MKRLIFTTFCLLLVLVGFAQVTQRNILAKTFKLEDIQRNLLAKNEFKPYPKTATEWQKALPDSVIKFLIKEGENKLAYKFEPISASVALDYVRSGDRERHSSLSFPKRNALMSLIVAESIEDKNRFTEAIINGLWSICEESYWGVPAHISRTGLPDVENPIVDLFTGETAALMGLVDYFVGEKLDKINPLFRKRIYFETNHRFFEAMERNRDKYGWLSRTKPVNNWNPWIMSNWIMSNLLLEKNEERRAKMLHQSMVDLDAYLNSLGDDGGCDEGPSYWTAAGASVYDCLELIQKATANKIQIYDNQLIKNMASYIYKTHIDKSYFMNFADADPKVKLDGLLLHRFGKAINDPIMMEFGKWANTAQANIGTDGFHRMRGLENLLYVKELPAGANNYQPVKSAWISDIQTLTARTDKGLFLATHGGHNDESHNHNDVGDFIIYLNGNPMILDAGRGNYTARTFSNKRYDLWFTQSNYHNLPIINGIGQKAGRTYEATNVKATTTDAEAKLEMDIAKAYPAEANLSKLNRTVKLDRLTNKIEVSDAYQFTQKPQSIQQIFMTICEVDISKKGKIGLKASEDSQLTLNYDDKKWKVSLDTPSTEGPEYNSFKTKWNKKLITRIVLEHLSPTQSEKALFLFE